MCVGKNPTEEKIVDEKDIENLEMPTYENLERIHLDVKVFYFNFF